MAASSNYEKYYVPDTVLSRTVGTDTILLNLETSTYHSLNAVGGRFWSLLLEGNDFQRALATIRAEYDVPSAQLESDLRALCAVLEGLSLLKKSA